MSGTPFMTFVAWMRSESGKYEIVDVGDTAAYSAGYSNGRTELADEILEWIGEQNIRVLGGEMDDTPCEEV